MAKIVVIDDSWLIRQTVTNMLTRAGHEVVVAENGRAGIDACVAQKPECILLDLLMPDLGGLEVLERLKNLGITTPVIVLTADIQETTQAKCREAGAADFVQKPPNEELLVYRVSKAMAARK